MTTRTMTPVFDGAVDLPVRVGWYPCWPKRLGLDWHEWRTERRYWNGRRFSMCVEIGDSDDLQERCKNSPSILENNQLYWCGLTAPDES